MKTSHSPLFFEYLIFKFFFLINYSKPDSQAIFFIQFFLKISPKPFLILSKKANVNLKIPNLSVLQWVTIVDSNGKTKAILKLGRVTYISYQLLNCAKNRMKKTVNLCKYSTCNKVRSAQFESDCPKQIRGKWQQASL